MQTMDGNMLFVVLGAILMVLTIVGVGATYAVTIRPQMKLKKRLAAIGSLEGARTTSNAAENRRQRRIQEKVKKLRNRAKSQSWTDQILLSMLRAGVQVSKTRYLVGCAVMGLASALVSLMFGLPGVGILPVALIGALGLPKLILKYMAYKRQKKFTSDFADAVDVVVRGIRSGLPVSECMNIIAREFDDPVGEEFRMIIEGERLGLTLEEILRRGLERMPTSEFKFFAIVLQIQRQTGGNLADTLGNLSGVLRARKNMRDKVQALASEAKSSAGIIGSLPFFVAGMLSILNPDYLMLLFTEDLGNYMLIGGLMWMSIGIAVMSKMINFQV
ncbi:MAG: type II secretion system F family protein [Alphaproteobacteria bacterium]|nr:type II secretion system F family protein [Alphaproteobacteria bacterium]